jgi:hypothetical protein
MVRGVPPEKLQKWAVYVGDHIDLLADSRAQQALFLRLAEDWSRREGTSADRCSAENG